MSQTKLEVEQALAPEVAEKLATLRSLLAGFESVLVAYSGGVDSALVMAVAYEQLGTRALACIGISPSYPTREMRNAVKVLFFTGDGLAIFYRRLERGTFEVPTASSLVRNRRMASSSSRVVASSHQARITTEMSRSSIGRVNAQSP